MRLCIGTAIATVVAGLASSAPAVAQTSFNGGYFGLTTGYGWGTSTQTGLLPPPQGPLFFDCIGNPSPVPVFCDDDAKLRTRGAMVGGALGWNFQYGTWIFGVEGDYSYAAVKGDSNTCGSVLTSPASYDSGLIKLCQMLRRL